MSAALQVEYCMNGCAVVNAGSRCASVNRLFLANEACCSSASMRALSCASSFRSSMSMPDILNRRDYDAAFPEYDFPPP